MSDEDWIKRRIEQARKPYPLVTESASTRLDGLLRSRLLEGPLTGAERNAVAKDLLTRMVPETPPGAAEQ